MEQALSTKKNEWAAVEYTSAWLPWENFPLEASFGKVSSSFALCRTCYLGRSKVTRCLLKPRMHGGILRPWQHMLYIPLYSKQWEIKHWLWGNVRFQVGGWRTGKTASPSGNLSDGMPNAMHLRKGVDSDSLLCVVHKKCLSLPVSFSLPCPCMLIACISAYKRCIHTHAHRVILGMKQKA